jgi:hypothetical protein
MDFYALRYEVSLNQGKASKIRPSEFRAIKYLFHAEELADLIRLMVITSESLTYASNYMYGIGYMLVMINRHPERNFDR